MSMPKKVIVGEVCPRDGWQNHPVHIPAEKKIEYINVQDTTVTIRIKK